MSCYKLLKYLDELEERKWRLEWESHEHHMQGRIWERSTTLDKVDEIDAEIKHVYEMLGEG